MADRTGFPHTGLQVRLWLLINWPLSLMKDKSCLCCYCVRPGQPGNPSNENRSWDAKRQASNGGPNNPNWVLGGAGLQELGWQEVKGIGAHLAKATPWAQKERVKANDIVWGLA